MASNKTNEKFKKEVKKCLVLEEKDKKFWLKNAEDLPNAIFKKVYMMIKKKNNEIESYIKIAALENPLLITELKQKIKKIKKGSLDIVEKEQNGNIEKILSDELSKI